MKPGQIYQGNHDLTMNNLRYKFDCDSLIMYRIFDLSILFQSFKYYIWEPFFRKIHEINSSMATWMYL